VFPSPTGKTLSQSTMPSLLRELEVGAVPHGFRSSFRDWAAECTDYPREVCELALAHVNSDRVEAAYRRSDLFEKRRTLMSDWAAYIGSAWTGRQVGAPLPPRSHHRCEGACHPLIPAEWSLQRTGE